MAIKSMKILSQKKDSFFYIESCKLINLYLKEKNDKLKGKEIIVDLAKEYAKDENKIIENKEETQLNDIRFKLYQKNLFNAPKENKDMVIQFIKDYDPKELRKKSGEEINNLIVFSSIYTDEAGTQEIKNNLNLKMRLFKINKQEVMRNFSFYEGKKYNKSNIFQLIKK